mgnify:CR=1 FL=1
MVPAGVPCKDASAQAPPGDATSLFLAEATSLSRARLLPAKPISNQRDKSNGQMERLMPSSLWLVTAPRHEVSVGMRSISSFFVFSSSSRS